MQHSSNLDFKNPLGSPDIQMCVTVGPQWQQKSVPDWNPVITQYHKVSTAEGHGPAKSSLCLHEKLHKAIGFVFSFVGH